ncbi:MAG TPA: GNAT family N-acetyltransferase [Terriglobales bacterium]|nr:GNAT family N-acetyltransferase [Terriglobales bacterium]
MSIGLSTRILTHPSDLRAIADEWDELSGRCPKVTPFQHPQWILAWISAFAPQNLNVVEVRSRGALVAIAPLLVYPRNGERVLAFAAGGVSDYLDVLVDPAFEDQSVAAMLEAINQLEGWDVFELTDSSANSALLRTWLEQYAAPHDSCSSLLLPQTESELLQLLSKRQRANLRNAHSRLDRTGGGKIEAATAETLPEFLNDLFCLHANRWAQRGESGVLADEAIRRFHRQAAPGLLGCGILHFTRLRVENRTAAALYTLHGQKTVFCYMQGFDPEFAYLSPGTQLMFSALANGIQLGMRKFDFLRGEESYKQHWRAQAETTFRIHAPRSALRTLHQSPVLSAVKIA